MTPPDNRFAALATTLRRPAPLPLPLRIWPLLRQLLPLALGLGCLWLLTQKLQDFDPAALRAAFGAIPLGGWAGALLATGLSFWAVGRYDAVIHRYLRTGIGDDLATRAGMCSIALAQTLGFGVITGSLARWRALPRISLAQSAQISVLVAVSFLAGLAVLLGICALLLPMPSLAKPFVFLPLLLAPLMVALALLHPVLRLPGGRRLAFPSLLAMAEIFWLTLLDTLAACAALYVLLPGDTGVTLAQLYPVFLLALGAALLSGTPGGVGPFELALLALLPHSPEPALLAGVLGFRLVYYALPASLALLVLLARPVTRARGGSGGPGPIGPARHPGPRLLAHAKRAELGVARQNGGRLLCAPEATGITVETGQTLTLLFDPAKGDMAALLPLLRRAAKSIDLVPLLYKCNARNAVAARRAGFALAHVADEAVIDPRQFDLSTRPLRQLRRKLSQARRAGLTTRRAICLPRADMARVDAQWCARQGAARGLTMGRFDHGYLSHHLVFLAWQGEHLMGFATFHVSAHEICLDLMRSADDAPTGTMHALIAAAIDHAAANGRTRLSLAAIPASPRDTGLIARHLRRLLFRASNGPGLARFKASFAPRYEPLYMAAPDRAALVLGAADLALAVRTAPAAHVLDEEFAIAPQPQM